MIANEKNHLIEYQLQLIFLEIKLTFFHRFAKRHAATGHFSLHLQEFLMDLPILLFISNKLSS